MASTPAWWSVDDVIGCVEIEQRECDDVRVLILTQYYDPEVGAPQVRLSAMVTELVKAGIEVEIVTALPNHPEGRIHPGYRRRLSVTEQRDGATVRRVWMLAARGAGLKRMLSYVSFTLTSLAGLVRSKRPDALFVESPPLFLVAPAWLAARAWRRPIVLNVADLWPDSAVQLGLLDEGLLLRVLVRFERWSYRRARYVNAVTDGVRNVLVEQKGVPPEKIAFLPNGVDASLFSPLGASEPEQRRYAPNGERLIVYAGTIGFAHGVEVAVDAMALVAERHRDARLLIVGGGSDRDNVARRIALTGVEANVQLVDPVPLGEVAAMYRVAEMGLSTLRDSPLFEATRPSKIFPILASGKPVIYSGAGEGARLIADGGCGIVTPPEDVDALADAICRVLEHPEQAAEMGRRGRQLAVECFSWTALVGDWMREVGWSDQ